MHDAVQAYREATYCIRTSMITKKINEMHILMITLLREDSVVDVREYYITET